MKKITIIILATSLMLSLKAQQNEKIVELKGKWKFNIGDEKEWSQVNVDDHDWETIYAPSPWEDQGFNGYDGFAWYRRNVVISSEHNQKSLVLNLGYIDDADEVYFNGQLIGFSGSMPPRYSTAFNALRKYTIPSSLIKYDKNNVIAIRVYDSGIAGGIVNGNIGIYADYSAMPLDINLQGIWKFRTGDFEKYSDPLFDDSKWRSITVPRTWEDQGYPDYDGFAWYRKKFLLTSFNTNERYVVVLGKIDDLEEVYLNGVYIGPTKKIEESEGTRYGELRVYYISGKLFQNNKYNVIAVRIKDNGGSGGIYEGNIGIVKQKSFVQYWKSKR